MSLRGAIHEVLSVEPIPPVEAFIESTIYFGNGKVKQQYNAVVRPEMGDDEAQHFTNYGDQVRDLLFSQHGQAVVDYVPRAIYPTAGKEFRSLKKGYMRQEHEKRLFANFSMSQVLSFMLAKESDHDPDLTEYYYGTFMDQTKDD